MRHIVNGEEVDMTLEEISEYNLLMASIITPTSEQVNTERERRMAFGSTFEVPLYGPIAITGRPIDQTLMMGLLVNAQMQMAQGVDTATMTIRDRDNVNHELTPAQMAALVVMGMNWIEQVMAVSWAMKDNGIPADYTDDSYWP